MFFSLATGNCIPPEGPRCVTANALLRCGVYEQTREKPGSDKCTVSKEFHTSV